MPTNPRRIVREKFRKRKVSCLKKVHELGSLCQAEVYILIFRNGKYYTYKSTNQPDWPPPDSEIVCSSSNLTFRYMLTETLTNRKSTIRCQNESCRLILRRRKLSAVETLTCRGRRIRRRKWYRVKKQRKA